MNEEQLADLGEHEVIRYLAQRFGRDVDGGLGIGDDGAVVPHATPLVAVADAMVEDIHFSRSFSPPNSVGRKLVAVNVSDIAAMGARPTIALFTFSAPGDLPWEWTRQLINGVADEAAAHGLRIVGGDVTGSPGPVSLSFSLFGELVGEQALRRDAAQPGEALYVTGTLGDAALGLQALMRGAPNPAEVPRAVQALHVPVPCTEEGAYLAEWSECRCAMDISDGLLNDSAKLARASGVDLVIDLDRLPLSDEVRAQGPRAAALATGGGEDYQLLFTATQAPPFPATRIGSVEAGQGVVRYTRAGEPVDPPGRTYEHF